MTKFPTESRDVVGLSQEDWPTEIGKVGPYCAVPGCAKNADHAHHLFSRGMMGGAYDWVKLPNGNVTGNLVPLCFAHHEKVTNNAVAITYNPEDGFQWVDQTLGRAQTLTYQPPLVLDGEKEWNGYSVEAPEAPRQELTAVPHEHEREICPTCARPMPKPKLDVDNDPEAPKQRKTWAVAVPNERWEDGADVLDELLEASREELDKVGLSYGEGKRVKYHLLATSLALFVQHAPKVLSDG